MRWFYPFVTWVCTPAIALILWVRSMKGKEPSLRRGERFGRSELPRPKGGVLWFHAASVGESASILPLIERISVSYPELHILLTTVTVSSAQLMEKKLPANAIHQFAPIDHPFVIRRFLRHWKPDLALWVESEFWPNMIFQTHKYGCKMMLVNARLSQQSYERWARMRNFINHILDCYEIIFPQSERDSERFKKLGALQLVEAGNIKYDSLPLPSDSKSMGQLVSMIGGRPVWLAASTHPGEEEMMAEVHLVLKELYPELLTIIVPRHAPRGPAIAAQLKGMGINTALRSIEDAISDSTDIYIADTMGELGLFYRIASIVFIGGTFVPHGGQNPLEAMRLDCAVLYGPYRDNFATICYELEAAGAALMVEDMTSLEETIDVLLKDHERQEKLAQTAMEFLEEKQGVVDSLISHLSPHLEKLSPARETPAEAPLTNKNSQSSPERKEL